ncbi:HAMP domain-containing sensor histidine kinase [Actinokineospora sp. NBRC 105648]|uniref:sensor histidine kinase n=1 Tax=Actinokineospora sp. NBRC 105648 TaxID=3032206 RepID=UPI0024A03BA3|nr:HAMP domain-containing sensor histidine kinase [Actinokineospora sp. NBRC 105648]GLZ43003.1 hypothetical protein Acsp05_66270 [Actinokineospora sp. NBRC 105648]
MDWSHDRRAGTGRRRADRDERSALNDLLHDLGHDLATLSLLTESVRADPALSPDTRTRVELIDAQVTRLIDLVRGGPLRPVDAIDVTALLAQLVSVFAAAGAPVELVPGEPVRAVLDPGVLWRVVANLVDNAVRAGGAVRVGASGGDKTVVEVADSGPGFGAGPPGHAGRGLGIVDGLVRAAGGTVEITPELPTGTRIRVTFGVVEPADGTPEAE